MNNSDLDTDNKVEEEADEQIDCDLENFSPEESDGENAKEKDEAFKDFLINWSIKYNIPHNALRPLIQQLRIEFNANLPKDPRTLMMTPKLNTASAEIKNIAGGSYWHQGLETCLRLCLNNIPSSMTIQININIDGIPLYNNGKDQFWPILCNIYDMAHIKPMVIGLFHGHSKPGSMNEYLNPFVNELTSIVQDGLLINSHLLSVKIRAIICDSPARAMIKCKRQVYSIVIFHFIM